MEQKFKAEEVCYVSTHYGLFDFRRCIGEVVKCVSKEGCLPGSLETGKTHLLISETLSNHARNDMFYGSSLATLECLIVHSGR